MCPSNLGGKLSILHLTLHRDNAISHLRVTVVTSSHHSHRHSFIVNTTIYFSLSTMSTPDSLHSFVRGGLDEHHHQISLKWWYFVYLRMYFLQLIHITSLHLRRSSSSIYSSLGAIAVTRQFKNLYLKPRVTRIHMVDPSSIRQILGSRDRGSIVHPSGERSSGSRRFDSKSGYPDSCLMSHSKICNERIVFGYVIAWVSATVVR